MRYAFLVSLLCAICFFSFAQTIIISSPDKKIVVSCQVEQMTYAIAYKGKTVMENSRLGLVREDEDFSKQLKVNKISTPQQVKDSYTLLTAKKEEHQLCGY